MRVDDFDFELPRELIADHPLEPREAARLLCVGATIADKHIGDLPDLLRAGDLMVFNDTRVIPARLTGTRGEARVEVTLHRETGAGEWLVFAKGAKRLKPGNTIRFAEDFSAEVIEKRVEGDVRLKFNAQGAELLAQLDRHGIMPLPPYIRRPQEGEAQDKHDYQTIFAARDGAVAAPTAGLHFTEDLLKRLDARGVGRVTVTLHVGAGTFLPVKVDDTQDHKMHSEWGEVDTATAARINETRARGGRIVAVGSTSLRILETAADPSGEVRPFSGETDIFITPGYRFRAIDLMFTNFHLPRSTLFMLVSAFSGLDRMRAAYEHAKAERYRFFSYGDACLLEPIRPR